MFHKLSFCFWLTVLWVMIVPISPAQAQTDSLSSQGGRFLLRFSPQHMLLEGYHLDVEKQWKAGGHQSLLLSPRVYAGNTNFADSFTNRGNDYEDRARVTGFGIEIQHRLYVNDPTDLSETNYYLGYGGSFHRFNIRFEQTGWVEELADDGLYYYQLRPSTFTETMNRWGAMLQLGLQEHFFSNRTFIDFYLTFGYNHTNSTTTYHQFRYNRNMMDYGHTGFYLYPGFKLGVIL